MTRTGKWALVASVGALITLGGVASAEQGWMVHGMGGKGGMMGGPALMQRYDANKDGKISQDEITQNRKATYDEFDANKDGKLGTDEFQALWARMRAPEMTREFQFFDQNGDGQVTLDEYQAPLASMVANRDANNDGFLSRDDRQAMQQQRRGKKHGHKQGHGHHGGWQQQGQMGWGGPGMMPRHGMMNGPGMMGGPGMMMGMGGGGNPEMMMQMHQRMMQQGWGGCRMMQPQYNPAAVDPGTIPPPPAAVGQPIPQVN